MKAHILTIGDEILIGQITDTNSTWIAQQLNLQGIRVVGKNSIGDVHEAIVAAIGEGLRHADLLLITGGLGATKDDITKKAIADFFGVTQTMHEGILQRLTHFFTKIGREVSEMNRLGCLMPTNAEILNNDQGLAPAMWFTTTGGKVIVSMPGVPFEMKHLMTDRVLPLLRQRFPMSPIAHRTILTAGEGETMLAEKIADFENALPDNVKLAYLPSLGQVRLRLTAVGVDENDLNRQLDGLQAQLLPYIQHYVFGFGETTLSESVGKILMEKGLTLATAESCTGGNVGRLITEVSGSSAYFMGGIVAYNNDIKKSILSVEKAILEAHGAVSEQTVIAMAQGAIRVTGADVAVAISGIAGPNGGTTEKPVGTIWLAVVDKNGNHKTALLKMNRGRLQNIESASIAALNLVRKFLQ